MASKLIPGYPTRATGGNPLYMQNLVPLDSDMSQYIHDNTEDEPTHEAFINQYLASKGAPTVDLDQFRTLSSSKATGANQFGRLTDLMQLTVDTSCWTRYRSRSQNPDFGNTTEWLAEILLLSSQEKAASILSWRSESAMWKFCNILLSIGGGRDSPFPDLARQGGQCTALSDVVDPVTGVKVTFPDLSPPFGGENFQTNLIMPEPTAFISRQLPACSIIRPTATPGAAMGALAGLTADGLFIGQSAAFFGFMSDLAESADAARREVN